MIRFDYVKRFEKGPALKLAAEIPSGEIVSVLGPSGSGKTTLALMLAGLTAPDAGFAEVNGEVFDDTARGVRLSPQERRIGFVFQSHRLFPAMTVRRNILFAQQAAGRRPTLAFDRLVEMLHISHLLERMPATLSGGEAQRVSLARALVAAENLLIMDEATASLDAALRRELVEHIRGLHQASGLSVLYITHSIEEAVSLSQTALWIEKGAVRACAPVSDIAALAARGGAVRTSCGTRQRTAQEENNRGAHGAAQGAS